MLRSLSFSGTDRNNRSSTPIQRLWRYLSSTELSGYRSERSLPIIKIVDDGHPLGLGNPNILRHIICHLDTSDLISLRRVSLRWNRISCEFLRRRLGPVQIRPSRIKQFLKLMKRCYCNPFGSYAIRIENLSELPIKNFFKRFSLDIIKLRVKISSDEIPNFFRYLKVLSNLEELYIIRIPEGVLYMRSDYIIPSAWFLGAFHFPKLKSIILENDEPTITFHRNYDAILCQVVNSAPNLVKIGFVYWDSHFARVISRCGISNPKSFDGWKFASSNPKLKEDLLELFYDQKMKFKAIKFWIGDESNNLSFELAMDLTLQTGESLYHLALRNDDPDFDFLLPMKLQRLLTLSLQGWRGPVEFLGLSRQLPNLKSLKLNPSNFSNFPIKSNSSGVTFIPTDIEIPTVDTLTIMPLDGMESNPVNEHLMRKLVTMFPCVKELYVQVDGNEPLHVVYQHWNRLTRLWVDMRGNGSDEGFTGIPSEVMMVTGHWECGCCRLAFPDDARRATHIGNLRDLRHLIIRSGCISDATLFEGISQLQKLQVLWLLPPVHVERVYDSDDRIDINDEERFHHMPKPWCLKAIADCFKHLRQLVTSCDVSYSDQDVIYLKEKLPDLVHEFKN